MSDTSAPQTEVIAEFGVAGDFQVEATITDPSYVETVSVSAEAPKDMCFSADSLHVSRECMESYSLQILEQTEEGDNV